MQITEELISEIHQLNKKFSLYLNEEAIEGELVDTDISNMKSANSSDNNSNSSSSGSSNEKQLPTVVENSEVAQKVVAIAQTTNTAVQEIVDTSPEVLVAQKILEIATLYEEAIKEIEEIKNSNLEEEEDKLEIIQLAKDIIEDYESALQEVKDKKKLTRQEVYAIIQEHFADLKAILSAKLPQDLIKSIAYSNPITAIVYQNADLIGNVGKAALHTIEKVFNLKGDKKK